MSPVDPGHLQICFSRPSEETRRSQINLHHIARSVQASVSRTRSAAPWSTALQDPCSTAPLLVPLDQSYHQIHPLCLVPALHGTQPIAHLVFAARLYLQPREAEAPNLSHGELAPGLGETHPTGRNAAAVAPAILEYRDERVLISGAPARLHNAVPGASWVVERGFLCTEVGEEHRSRREERGVGEGVRDEQSLCIVGYSGFNEDGKADEGESVRGVSRREGEDMSEEWAEVPPVVGESVAVIWIWERCRDGGVADGREEGDTQLVASREEYRVDLRQGSSVFEHRCVGSEMRDSFNALYARDAREGQVSE